MAWCSPSRNSFLSGRRPDRTRIWTTLGTAPGKGFRAAPGAASWLTLTGYFKRYGYTVTAAGKCFHPDEPANNDPQSWTEPDEWKYSFGGYTTCDGVALSRSGPSWCAVLDNETAADTLIATAMAQRLVRFADAGGRNGSQPFFAMTGFLKPHLPYAYPARYDALYPGDPTQSLPTARPRGSTHARGITPYRVVRLFYVPWRVHRPGVCAVGACPSCEPHMPECIDSSTAL